MIFQKIDYYYQKIFPKNWLWLPKNCSEKLIIIIKLFFWQIDYDYQNNFSEKLIIIIKLFFWKIDYDYQMIFQKKSTGQVILDRVCEHLNLLEKDYFALTYKGLKNVKVGRSRIYMIHAQTCASRLRYYVIYVCINS